MKIYRIKNPQKFYLMLSSCKDDVQIVHTGPQALELTFRNPEDIDRVFSYLVNQ